jgi:hypothetical protein
MIIKNFFSARRGQLIPVLMLLLLHISLSFDLDSPLARSLMLAHLGLFLIWQPVWRSDQHLNWLGTVLFFALTITFIVWLNWWLIAGWLVLLIGFTGGRVTANNYERYSNILVLTFLVIALLITCATNLFTLKIDPDTIAFFDKLSYLILLSMLLIPTGSRMITVTEQADLFGALTTSLIASLVLLGSLVNTYPLVDKGYATAVTETIVILGVFLLLISWLLSPRGSFSGLAQLWTRSLLNIGTPFEQWISQIANHARDKHTPDDFIEAATQQLIELPMIEGVQWQTTESSGQCGRSTNNPVELKAGDVTIRIMTSRIVGPSLLLHFKLLIRIIEHFYIYKVQERKLARHEHLQAIYETGARVTHDIKNLLQTLQNLTAAAAAANHEDNDELMQAFKKQLPHITKRLQLALDKLQAPTSQEIVTEGLRDWWDDLRTRTFQGNIIFNEKLTNNPLIPADLFDSFIDNMIENFEFKLMGEPDITATISLVSDADYLSLEFCDSGSSIPGNIVNHILAGPVESSTGLGIGLYQVARQAEMAGYLLTLKSNMEGKVCFELCVN